MLIRKRPPPIVKNFFPFIRDEFTVYETFRISLKVAKDDAISLVSRHKNGPYDGRSELTAIVAGCAFEAEVSAANPPAYHFRITSKFFGEEPCMRFDSAGSSHCNEEDGSGLPSRGVPTPHFHKVDNDGWMRAYHNSALSDPQQRDAIQKDITFGAKSFCQEFNLSAPNGGPVVLKHIAAVLPLSMGAIDAASFP